MSSTLGHTKGIRNTCRKHISNHSPARLQTLHLQCKHQPDMVFRDVRAWPQPAPNQQPSTQWVLKLHHRLLDRIQLNIWPEFHVKSNTCPMPHSNQIQASFKFKSTHNPIAILLPNLSPTQTNIDMLSANVSFHTQQGFTPHQSLLHVAPHRQLRSNDLKWANRVPGVYWCRYWPQHQWGLINHLLARSQTTQRWGCIQSTRLCSRILAASTVASRLLQSLLQLGRIRCQQHTYPLNCTGRPWWRPLKISLLHGFGLGSMIVILQHLTARGSPTISFRRSTTRATLPTSKSFSGLQVWWAGHMKLYEHMFLVHLALHTC